MKDILIDEGNDLRLLAEIKKQLEYDGMQINDVALQEGGKLLIDGTYNNN